jgi:mRNA-degrading endonuclease RelE of RelBE toxin-antitoxin system
MQDDIVKRLTDYAREMLTRTLEAEAEITALRAEVGLWKLRSGNRLRLLTDVEAERDRLKSLLEKAGLSYE